MKKLFGKGMPLLLAWLLSLTMMQALPGGARADGPSGPGGASGGSTNVVTEFYAYANRSGYVKLASQKGTAYVADYDYFGNFSGYKTEEDYGFYHVQVSTSGYTKTYEWVPAATLNTYGMSTDPSLVVVFPSAGDYKIVVTPMAKDEINGTYWPQNRFQYWAADATWDITTKINCAVTSSSSRTVTQATSPTQTGPQTQTPTQTGPQAQTPTQTGPQGFQPSSPTGPQTATQPSTAGQVTVYCYDGSGNYISSYTQAVSASGTIYPQSIPGYTSSSSGKYITLTNGYCSPSSVNFYYQAIQTTGTVTIQCYDTSGSYIRSYTETVNGSGTVYPRSITGYTVNSAGQYVAVSGGVANPSTLTFYYRQNLAPAQVTVNCYDVHGNLLKTYKESITASQSIAPPAISGYTTMSSAQTVTYADGACYPTEISFAYNLTGTVNPADYTDARMVVPQQWDTQFKPGTATASNGSNAGRLDTLFKIYDNNAGTSFWYVYWQSEGHDEIPEFTVYFNGETVSTIGIRNGLVSIPSQYADYGRVQMLEIRVYDNAGHMFYNTFEVADTCSDSYIEYPLLGTIPDVNYIEIWVRGIYAGTGRTQNVIHISDITFFK